MAIMSTTPSTISPGSIFSFPPPPPSSAQPPVLPPPPSVIGTSSKPTPPSHPVPQPLSARSFRFVNGDELSDFYQPTSARFDTSISSAFSDDGLMPASSSTTTYFSNDLLDDFDDFVSSPLRTPSPPRPPQKPALASHKPKPSQQPKASLRSISPDKPQPPLPPRKTSRAADHRRTMSLLETAAARPGRWPAPPSPLPEAIPPPGTTDPSFDSDLFAGGSTMQTQQINTIASLGSSVSSPASFSLETSASRLPVLTPVPSSTLSSSPLNFQAMSANQPKQQGSSLMAVTSPGTSGLSAQDLSFFEGL
jgi:hypothetical protein